MKRFIQNTAVLSARIRFRYGARISLLTLTVVVLLSGFCSGRAARAEDVLTYNRDIRPVLAEKCFTCHGPDSAARKGDLRLDQREAAVESGAIAPGKSDESGIIARILSADPDELMPPPDSHKE